MSIALLPENVSNQIAAGEVIERPANVVKELLENSLDAGATSIEVQFRSGGNSLIKVSDNGKGMDEKDALLCFKRHATSKLESIDDLQTLHSFGFRGEALPSIASVSKVTLKTKQFSSNLGTQVETNDGKSFKSLPCACSHGTTFTVEQLFFNVPVRRKFLKSEATESAHIINCVRLYAAAYPNVQFTLKQEDRVVFSVQSCDTISQRIADLWPKRPCKSWLSIEGQSDSIEVNGWICPPGEGYASSQELYLFLNQRPIACTFLMNTLRDCYRSYLPSKTYPLGFLFLKIPGTEFDLNVHPSKREVRFKNEQKLRQWIANVITQRLESVRMQPFGITHADSLPSMSSFKSKDTHLKHWVCDKISDVRQQTKPQSNSSKTRGMPESTPEKLPRNIPDRPAEENRKKSHLQFFALWKNRYAFFNESPYLLILDCIGAQKRIQYERIVRILESNQVGPLQNILFPYVFTLNPIDAACLMESIDYLNLRKICSIKPKEGKTTFELQALPQWVPLKQMEMFINHLAQSLAQYGQNQTLLHLFEPFLHKLSQAHIPDPVLSEEQVRLVQEQLNLCQNPITDPEGHKLWKQLSEIDLLR